MSDDEPTDQSNTLPTPTTAYYNAGREAARLFAGTGQLELVRTQELLLRYLPSPPAVIYDVGGGAGVYALWLARLGYTVHLLDAVPLHIDQAQQAAQAQPTHPLADALVGDARHLPWPSASADALLLLGPLYHLTDRDDRLSALREAVRVLRPGGLLAAAAITRCASALDGLARDLLDDPLFAAIVEQDLRDGQHRNPTNHLGYFTTAYFHRPDDLAAEVQEAGLHDALLLPVEGPAWLLSDFTAWWENDTRRERLLQLLRWLEHEPSALGMSAHILAIARKDR